MNAGDLLTAEHIAIAQTAEDRDSVIKRLVELVCERGFVTKKEKLYNALTERESEGSTGVGSGVAIPHCRTVAVKKPLLFAMTLEKPVDFDSYDGKPVDVVFMIATPDNGDKSGNEIMSSLSLKLMDDELIGKLRSAADAEGFLALMNGSASDGGGSASGASKPKKKIKLAAVTGCPNGVVKCYQAADALEKAAKKAGYTINIEKRGLKSSEDVLSAGNIADAGSVIIASDIDVPMERFDGKKIVKCTVDECVKAPAEYLEKAASGKESQYDAAKAKKERTEKTAKSGNMANHGIAGFIAMILPFFTGAAVLALFACVLNLTGAGTGLFAAFTDGGKNLAIGIIAAIIAGFIASLVSGDEGMAVGFFGGMLIVWSHVIAAVVCAVVVGFTAGLFARLLKMLFAKIPAKLTWLKTVFLIPISGIILEAALVWFAINTIAVAVTSALIK